MKILRVCLIFSIGFLLGAFGVMMHRPRAVHAQALGHLKLIPVSEQGLGNGQFYQGEFRGFACTAEACYVLVASNQ